MSFCIKVIQDLKILEDTFHAEAVQVAFKAYENLSKADPKHFKPLSQRTYVKYWAPVICMNENKRVIVPMRYRFRPYWAEEDLPSKYSLNTARLDTLTSSKIWKTAYGKYHGILAFESFLEWVRDPKDKKRKLVSFKPTDHPFMWAPVIYAQAPDKTLSFALITDEPTPEILQAGYDRCAVFLKKEAIKDWLEPQGKTESQLNEILHQRTPVHFGAKIIRVAGAPSSRV